jgi:translation initiation factor IF-2
LDKLKEKIKEVAHERVNLLEDYTTKAQCIVIESDVDEKSNQITATVIVKKGTLRLEDLFVSGVNDGKVRLLMNDMG